MTNSDRLQFSEAIAGLAATFGRECDEPMFRGYWMGLDDLDIGDVLRGCKRALRECERMPTVGELRRLGGEMAIADRSLLAWSHFANAVGSVGAYKSVDFDDRLINATVRHLGGWVRVCDLSETEFQTWLRKDFLRTYEAFCRTGISAEAGAALTGIHQRENRILGYDDERTSLMAPGCAGAALRIETGLPKHPAALPASGGRVGASVGVPRLEFKRP